MILRALAACFALLVTTGLSSPAQGVDRAPTVEPADSGMPVITTTPDGSPVAHDARRPVTVSYTDATHGWYTLKVACDAGPDVGVVQWTAWQRWKGQDGEQTQTFEPKGGLPPGSSCTATLLRDDDSATVSHAFDVVWGDYPAYLYPIPAQLWPAPEDGGQTLRVVVDLKEPGDYDLVVESTKGYYHGAHELRGVDPGRYAWEWDGRRANGNLVPEGRYFVAVDGRPDSGYDNVHLQQKFWVKHGTDAVTVSDRRGDWGSRHIDLGSFTLSNGAEQVELTYRFRKLERSSLRYLSAGLDVDRLDKGYLIDVTRTRRGAFRPTLSLAHLGTDQGRPERIRCGDLGVTVGSRAATVTVPRSCLTRGGRDARAFFGAGDEHGHYDSGPDRDYWTPWVTYEVPKS